MNTLNKLEFETRVEDAFDTQSEALEHAYELLQEELCERYGDIVGAQLMEYVEEVEQEEYDGVEWVDNIYLTQHVVGYTFKSNLYENTILTYYFDSEEKEQEVRRQQHLMELDYRDMVGF